MKKIIIVDNGECYSDYGVIGVIVCEENSVSLVEQVVQQAATEYKRLRLEAYEKKGVVVYPNDIKILTDACKMNNMEFIDAESVSFHGW
jgi:hypothetical protein